MGYSISEGINGERLGNRLDVVKGSNATARENCASF